MELLVIAAVIAAVGELWVDGRLGCGKGVIPPKVWTVLAGLLPAATAARRPPSAVSHRSLRAKRGHYYVNTSR